ncbi:hypothetical protein RF11_02545 [Thelohanellus kitauei]|uniref:Uncharacterized protein n=1 Tax=Thelohanellus kitauei TaxID=669202 RepID=A0A0C2J4Z1_THEKT|nr:hypothetical protein RF11_02545 [Thelohanellus kitauei]
MTYSILLSPRLDIKTNQVFSNVEKNFKSARTPLAFRHAISASFHISIACVGVLKTASKCPCLRPRDVMKLHSFGRHFINVLEVTLLTTYTVFVNNTVKFYPLSVYSSRCLAQFGHSP